MEHPSPLRVFYHTASAWGLWPALVMVFSQWEAARLSASPYPPRLAALTAAGTLFIYGADRFLERLNLAHLAQRHARGPGDLIFVIVVATLTLVSAPMLSLHLIVWLGPLAVAGMLYLGVTIGKLRLPTPGKEILGASIFCWLTWGWLETVNVWVLVAFFCCGLSNFLFAAHQDRFRDGANGLPSLAVTHTRLNLALARIVAGTGTFGLALQFGAGSPLVWVGLCHTCWPEDKAIDGAFLCLPAVALLALMG